MSEIRLTWEDSEEFFSFLVSAGYTIEIISQRKNGDITNKITIYDGTENILAEISTDYAIDVSTLIMQCLNDYINTRDGKTMFALWESN